MTRLAFELLALLEIVGRAERMKKEVDSTERKIHTHGVGVVAVPRVRSFCARSRGRPAVTTPTSRDNSTALASDAEGA